MGGVCTLNFGLHLKTWRLNGRRKTALGIIGKHQYQNKARILGGSRDFQFVETSNLCTGQVSSLLPTAVPPEHNVTLCGVGLLTSSHIQ